MTRHYFKDPRVNLHYYKYGAGDRKMLCFHGYGMHGKQFRILETELGSKYTFYGFDLFFHKETKLSDQSLEAVKKGISKREWGELIADFCRHEQIDRFSVIGYSMGTHYATAIAEEMGARIDEYIVAAPASINPGILVRYLSKNKLGNKLLERLTLSDNAFLRLLRLYKGLGFMDAVSYDILYREICTPELRFNFYATLTYLRHLDTDDSRLEEALQKESIKSIFIFGKHDRMYPPQMGNKLIPKLKNAQVIVLDENHEMINKNFVSSLSEKLL